MAFTHILKKVLRAQEHILAGIFCDEEGEMVVMVMQSELVIDEFEFKVLAAKAARWVQTLTRIQGAEKKYPDVSLRFAHYQVLVQVLPQDHYLMFLALPRVPMAQLRSLLQVAAKACIDEI